MKYSIAIVICLLCLALPAFAADDKTKQELIDLDKKWGEAGLSGDTKTISALIAEDVVSVDGNGVSGKAQVLAEAPPADRSGGYQPGDYKVHFLNDQTAIMTHGTKGSDQHWSLHVWAKRDGRWQVIATSSVPVEE